jgi:hypothetical protein
LSVRSSASLSIEPEVAVLETALDDLIARFGAEPHIAEAAAARAEHAERTGRVFEEDELYEARIVSFLEWYVLERRHGAAGVAPVRLALRDEGAGERADAWRAWAASHRSLFLVIGLGDGRVLLDDLVGGGRFAVSERRRLPGINRGDVFEARLVGWQGAVRFGRSFCDHPAAAIASIRGHAARIRDGGGCRADVVDYVAALRVKALRYKHVAPVRVYQGRL